MCNDGKLTEKDEKWIDMNLRALEIERAEIRHWQDLIPNLTFWIIAGIFGITAFFVTHIASLSELEKIIFSIFSGVAIITLIAVHHYLSCQVKENIQGVRNGGMAELEEALEKIREENEDLVGKALQEINIGDLNSLENTIKKDLKNHQEKVIDIIEKYRSWNVNKVERVLHKFKEKYPTEVKDILNEIRKDNPDKVWQSFKIDDEEIQKKVEKALHTFPKGSLQKVEQALYDNAKKLNGDNEYAYEGAGTHIKEYHINKIIKIVPALGIVAIIFIACWTCIPLIESKQAQTNNQATTESSIKTTS